MLKITKKEKIEGKTIRLPVSLWESVRQAAMKSGRSESDVVKHVLENTKIFIDERDA